MVFYSIQRSSRRNYIKCNFSWMGFECKTNAQFMIFIKDWYPPCSKVLVSLVYHKRCNRGKRVEKGPYRTSCKTGNSINTQPFSCFRCTYPVSYTHLRAHET